MAPNLRSVFAQFHRRLVVNRMSPLTGHHLLRRHVSSSPPLPRFTTTAYLIRAHPHISYIRHFSSSSGSDSGKKNDDDGPRQDDKEKKVDDDTSWKKARIVVLLLGVLALSRKVITRMPTLNIPVADVKELAISAGKRFGWNVFFALLKQTWVYLATSVAVIGGGWTFIKDSLPTSEAWNSFFKDVFGFPLGNAKRKTSYVSVETLRKSEKRMNDTLEVVKTDFEQKLDALKADFELVKEIVKSDLESFKKELKG